MTNGEPDWWYRQISKDIPVIQIYDDDINDNSLDITAVRKLFTGSKEENGLKINIVPDMNKIIEVIRTEINRQFKEGEIQITIK